MLRENPDYRTFDGFSMHFEHPHFTPAEVESLQRELYRKCFERLGKKARFALERRYVRQEKPAEIAAAMNWEPSSVYVLLNRSKQNLLKCLESGSEAPGAAS